MGAASLEETEPIKQQDAWIGHPSIKKYSLCDVDVFDVAYCKGVSDAYYEDHHFAMITRSFVCEANWEGRRLRDGWQEGSAAFVPAHSHLSYLANNAHDQTAIRLKHGLFQVAARDHIDFNQIDFSFSDVTAPATWRLGVALDGIVRDREYRSWPLLVESAALSLTLAIIHEISPGSTLAFNQEAHGLGLSRRHRVLDFIKGNLSRPITLDEVAKVASLSVYHFSRQFKSEIGMTPLRYISSRRVEHAMRMLRSTSDPLVDVAISCGFCSQSHFSTAFKKVTGTTPAQYRASGR